MSGTLASTIDPPETDLPVSELPCIFGEGIRKNCSVRQTLSRPTDISKWQKPKNAALDDFQGIINMATNMINPAIMGLYNFCQCCPHLEVFAVKTSLELEKEFTPKKGKKS